MEIGDLETMRIIALSIFIMVALVTGAQGQGSPAHITNQTVTGPGPKFDPKGPPVPASVCKDLKKLIQVTERYLTSDPISSELEKDREDLASELKKAIEDIKDERVQEQAKAALEHVQTNLAISLTLSQFGSFVDKTGKPRWSKSPSVKQTEQRHCKWLRNSLKPVCTK
jgi:hypothetical protein